MLIAVRALSIVVALTFLRASAREFFGAEETVRHFAEWGYPQGLRILVASIELVGAGLLLFRRTRRVACVLLSTIMLGAIGTELLHGAYAKAIAPVVVLGVLAFLATRKATELPSRTTT
jgi:uncharacterized membrane protein YphA (DoxX/SURF4 family)